MNVENIIQNFIQEVKIINNFNIRGVYEIVDIDYDSSNKNIFVVSNFIPFNFNQLMFIAQTEK